MGSICACRNAVSLDKEQWEPTIHKLLQLDAEGPNVIREAWALDLFNHGQAALQNRRVIKEHGIVCCTDSQTEMTRNFYTLPRFRGHRIVAVAHSGSSTYWYAPALLHTTQPSCSRSLVFFVARRAHLTIHCLALPG